MFYTEKSFGIGKSFVENSGNLLLTSWICVINPTDKGSWLLICNTWLLAIIANLGHFIRCTILAARVFILCGARESPEILVHIDMIW